MNNFMKIILFLLLLCISIQLLFAQHKCEKDFLKTTFLNGNTETSVLLIWFPTNAGTQSALRLCSNETGLPLQRHCSYDRLKDSSKWEEINEHIQLINCSSIPNLCHEEPFQHYYIMRNGIKEPFDNKWKTTKMMERGDLEEPCLQSTGLPITRPCVYNPVMKMAQWELLRPEMRDISCLKETREVVVTYELNTLYQEVKRDEEENKVEPEQVVQQMTEMLTTSQTVRIPADIKISGEILKIITEDTRNPELVTGVLNVTDIIMDTNPHTIIKSEEVNATTTFLKTIDKYLHKMAKVMVPTSHCQSTTDGIVYKTFKRTSIFYINPSCSNISGVAIYKTNVQNRQRFRKYQRYDEHTSNYYRFLYLNQTLEQILSEPDLRLATYFPLSLWNKLKNETGSVDDQTVLTFIIFENDLLFINRTTMQRRPTRNILEISIPNYSGELPDDVPFIFSYRPGRQRTRQASSCGYWNYSTWITTGIKTQYRTTTNNNLLICHSTHLTHFAAIFGVSFMSSLPLEDSIMLSIPHDLMLDYISILGCGLSLMGLSCIWLTAMCFRSFRAEPSNKVLLNMCLVLSLLMVFFLLLNLPQLWKSYIDMRNTVHCRIMGAFLHYIVMVLFFWMLIIAIMQYQRYVRVLGYERPSNYITKYAVVAWGMPLVPVCLVAHFQPDTYMQHKDGELANTGICYPSGESLKYGVILPMALIMMANLGIFIYIFCSLRHSLCQFRHHNDRRNIIIQIRVSILLFFLLGISWLFGLLSHLEGSPLFSYIFCLTSTLQGFVLFLYSIIIDKSTRSSWIILCCAKNYDTMEDTNQVKYINTKTFNRKMNN